MIAIIGDAVGALTGSQGQGVGFNGFAVFTDGAGESAARQIVSHGILGAGSAGDHQTVLHVQLGLALGQSKLSGGGPLAFSVFDLLGDGVGVGLGELGIHDDLITGDLVIQGLDGDGDDRIVVHIVDGIIHAANAASL